MDVVIKYLNETQLKTQFIVPVWGGGGDKVEYGKGLFYWLVHRLADWNDNPTP